MILWIDNDRTEPAWNLAAEEHLLCGCAESYGMLWRNGRSVIIGRNQELEAEVDTELAAAKGIKIVRRLSGGGAVFHDLGNINYTYIYSQERGTRHKMSFEPFARPLIRALAEMGVKAELSGRNDILVEGRKVSGCAHAMAGDRVLYHGTLLYSAELSEMEGLLRYSEEKYAGRGVRSVSARVRNLSEYMGGMAVEEFMLELRRLLLEYGEYRPYSFTAEDIAAIDKLRDTKYGNIAWTKGGRSDGAL